MNFHIGNRNIHLIEISVFLMIVAGNINSILFFKDSTIDDVFSRCIELLVYFALVLSILVKNIKFRNLGLLVVFALLSLIIIIKSGTFVFIVAILVYFNASNIEFYKVTDAVWKAYILLLITSFLLYFMGLSDGGMMREYSEKRMAPSLGFAHPNSGGYIFTMAVVAKYLSDIGKYGSMKLNSKPWRKNIVFLFISIYFTFFVFKCRTATIMCLTAIILGMFFRKIKFSSKFLKVMVLIFHPIMLVITYISATTYPNSITLFLDKIITSRFFLLNYHLQNNTLTLFGGPVDYSIYTLDNSYMSYLLEYGMVPSLLFMFGSMLALNKALKNKDGSIIAVSIALLLYGFTENGVFGIFSNIMYLYLLVGNGLQQNKNKVKQIINKMCDKGGL